MPRSACRRTISPTACVSRASYTAGSTAMPSCRASPMASRSPAGEGCRRGSSECDPCCVSWACLTGQGGAQGLRRRAAWRRYRLRCGHVAPIDFWQDGLPASSTYRYSGWPRSEPGPTDCKFRRMRAWYLAIFLGSASSCARCALALAMSPTMISSFATVSFSAGLSFCRPRILASMSPAASVVRTMVWLSLRSSTKVAFAICPLVAAIV